MEKNLAKKKAEFFRENDMMIHIVLLNTKKFFNGKVLNVNNDLLLLNDKKLGKIPIYYQEIYSIDKYEE